MSLNSFLYRRFSRWVTCELKLTQNSKISLRNKYEIASFKDVFCHPFYWQIVQWIHNPPRLVVDCGAHCGHFSILADLCFSSKFGASEAKYILVEPNPYLLPMIHKNIVEAGLEQRVHVEQGLLGVQSGYGTLWINHRNYLATGLSQNKGTKPVSIPYVDLSNLIGAQTIDLMKIDIEGGEFEFVRSHAALFNSVNLLVMELHDAPLIAHEELLKSLNAAGLQQVMQPMKANGQQLLILQRQPVLTNALAPVV